MKHGIIFDQFIQRKSENLIHSFSVRALTWSGFAADPEVIPGPRSGWHQISDQQNTNPISTVTNIIP